MIDKSFINKYSIRYQYRYHLAKSGENLEAEIRRAMRKRPRRIDVHLLYKIVAWKAPRIKARVKLNEERLVKEITGISFSTKNERLRIEILTLLEGVSYRVASTVLHFRFPNKYTIMDFRAWESLQDSRLTRGEKEGCKFSKRYKIADDFEHWTNYLQVCRRISKREKCSLRELDKALWQYSKEDY